MKIRRALAWPFKAVAWLMLTLAFMISFDGMDDTLGRWLRREIF